MQAGFFRPWFVNSLPLITYPEPWFMVRGKESGCCQRDPISPPTNSHLPFPDSEIVLMRGRWFTNLVTQASTHLANQDHEIYSVATKTHSSYKDSKFNGFIKLEPFLDECQGAALFWPSQISIDKMRRADSLLPFPGSGMLA